MANHKSAEKRARQSKRKAAVNSKTRSAVRTAERRLLKALESKDMAEAKSLLVGFMSQVDKAAQKGVFHAKTAARKVARLSKRLSGLS